MHAWVLPQTALTLCDSHPVHVQTNVYASSHAKQRMHNMGHARDVILGKNDMSPSCQWRKSEATVSPALESLHSLSWTQSVSNIKRGRTLHKHCPGATRCRSLTSWRPRWHHTQGAKNPKRLRSPSLVRFSKFSKMDDRASCDGCAGCRRLVGRRAGGCCRGGRGS